MTIENTIESFVKKYSGEVEKDFENTVDPELAKMKYLADESIEIVDYNLRNLKEVLRFYFMSRHDGMGEKSERYLLDANRLAHDLIYESLALWNLTEKAIESSEKD